MLTEALATSHDQTDIAFNKRQLMVKENAIFWATSLKEALEKENIPVKFPSSREGFSGNVRFPLKEMAETMVSVLKALINQTLRKGSKKSFVINIQRELLVTAIAQVQHISLVHKAQCLLQIMPQELATTAEGGGYNYQLLEKIYIMQRLRQI